MGREIRRVPAGWEHPRDWRGHYIGMFDKTYEDAVAEWIEDGADDEEKPGREWYRPAFTAEATHYQIYETVSEGTSTSPVFASLDEMEAWLISEGFSAVAAARFVKDGWAPSFIMIPKHGVSGLGIHSLDFPPQEG